jgi:dihydrofolate reductase
MGRRKLGPQTGPWTDDEWCGWWGDEPPFETTVFVMTHYPRPTIDFANGTSFHVVDGTPEEVRALAREAAGGKDVRIGGGPTTVREFLSVGLVDVMQVVPRADRPGSRGVAVGGTRRPRRR